jgi:hypothetical protein
MAAHGSTMVTSVLANLILATLADSLTNSALGVLVVLIDQAIYLGH